MSNRYALVIASQWDASGDLFENLAEEAEALRDALLDRDFGDCLPAHGDGLLLNPGSVEEVRHAVAGAFARANSDGTGPPGALVIAFVGHGHSVRADDFLFPLRSTPRDPDAATAYSVPSGLRDGLERNANVLALVTVLDTCDSGMGAMTGMREWLPLSMERGREIAVVTSAATDQRAFDLSFVRGLNRILTEGHARLDRLLYEEGLRWALGLDLRGQQPQSARHGGGHSRPTTPDAAHWIARNAAYLRPYSLLAASPTGLAQLAHLQLFQASTALEDTVDTLAGHRAVAVVGHSGQGKSVLAAAICRPELLSRRAPFTVAALVQLSEGSLDQRITAELNRQLVGYLPGFAAACADFEREVPKIDRDAMPAARRLIAEPLSRLTPERPVRIIVDALDQLGLSALPRVLSSLRILVDDTPSWFGVIATSRTGLPLPADWHAVTMPTASDEQIEAFIEAHSAWQPTDRQRILRQAAGNWQVASLLAASGPSASDRPTTHTIYEKDLDRARRLAPDGNSHWVDAVLNILCAAGHGPRLPRPLLHAATGRLVGPEPDAVLDTVLDLLPGFLDRVPDQHVEEYIGIHHQTLLDHLGQNEPELEPVAGHRALVDVIATMAPMEHHDAADPLHGYAEDAEPRHFWELGEYNSVLTSLEQRRSADAAVNSERWLSWYDRLSEPGRPGPTAPVTLRARQWAAYWAGRAGLYGRSREMYEELLPLQQRVLGPDHDEVLESRHRIAYATGKAGHFLQAIALHQALLADQLRVLGPDDRRTMETRHHISYWIGRGGAMAESLRMHEELLSHQLRCLGPKHQDVLETRHYIAYWYGRLGRLHEALERHHALLRDRVDVFGEDHEQVVYSRMNICKFTYEAGRHRDALTAYRELLPQVIRHKGNEHPDTLLVRQYIARLVWEVGDPADSLHLHAELIEVQQRVNGADHPSVLTTRHSMAWLHGELGDPGRARAELEQLCQERIAHHGRPDHPDVLTTRLGLAWWTAVTGAAAEGAEMMRTVVTDRIRILGPTHPESLDAASRLGAVLARLGGPSLAEAADVLRSTVPKQERHSGPDHPQTRATRDRLADVLAQLGQPGA